jgi:hypothetical protein
MNQGVKKSRISEIKYSFMFFHQYTQVAEGKDRPQSTETEKLSSLPALPTQLP